MIQMLNDIVFDLGRESWNVLVEMSPSLLLGLLVAGGLHVFLPKDLIRRRLSSSRTRSVFEAVLLGVPMPLCSCGVLPTALGMKNQGASKGAATGFLISTPQTGVDSILVSATFLGWPFALFKVAAAFLTGMIGGLLVNATEPSSTEEKRAEMPVEPIDVENRYIEIFRYAVFDILATIDIWIIFGVVVSAVITLAIPPGYLENIDWIQSAAGLSVVLVLSLAMYVCSTSSVPIAASMIAAGMPVGSALVFLMAGPATNAATVGSVLRVFGRRVLIIYLSTVALMSILLGMTFDFVIATPAVMEEGHVHGAGGWWQTGSAIVVGALLVFLLSRRVWRRLAKWFRANEKTERRNDMSNIIKVKGMTCQHCVANVKKAIESLDGVDSATPNLSTGEVVIEGENTRREELARAVQAAGYQLED